MTTSPRPASRRHPWSNQTGSNRIISWLLAIAGVLAIVPNTAMSARLEVELLDQAGPGLICRGEGGHLLAKAQPLIRWNDGTQPDSRRTADGWQVHLSPRGIEAQVRPMEPGRFGEARFRINLRNTANQRQFGMLLPAFCGWYRDQAPLDNVSSQHAVLLPGELHIGRLGTLRTWLPGEFARDNFSVMPSEQTGISLTATLLHQKGPGGGALLDLPAGGGAEYILCLDAIPGDRNAVLREIYRIRGGYRVDPTGYDFTQYQDPALAWARDILAGWLNFAWDKDVLDPLSGEYRLVNSLQAARQRFGGFDVYMLWPFWPRAGWDARFQFDHFAEMPGGLDGLRDQFRQARKLGVRAIVTSCHWSETDRDPADAARTAGYRQLVDLACAVEADGVIMDLMSTTPEEIRDLARARGRELVPYAEFDPNWTQSQTNLLGRIHNGTVMPALNLKKYLLPHHPQLRVCVPGQKYSIFREDLVLSFFNGHGVEINTMFGETHPEGDKQDATLARMLDLLRTNRDCFTSTEWEPLIAGLDDQVRINRWPATDKTLYTLCRPGNIVEPQKLLRVTHSDRRFVDLWRYRPVQIEHEGEYDLVLCSLESDAGDPSTPHTAWSVGCIGSFEPRLQAVLHNELLSIAVNRPRAGEQIEIWVDRVRPDVDPVVLPAEPQMEVDLQQWLGRQTNAAIILRLVDNSRQLRDVLILPAASARLFHIDKPLRTPPADAVQPPAGMVRIAAGTFEYRVQHGATTWLACDHLGTSYDRGPPSPARKMEIKTFWIDRYPVTNAQFAEFVRQSNYQPTHPANFLKHFVDGRPPEGKLNHPVVYVSYDDAKAYAAWAGKRLPTEAEWQYAAGAADGRPWPWGSDPPSGERCNLNDEATTPVEAHPAGASPFGVEDLVGNVWQWTLSLSDNGRHMLVFLRGGSWYQPPNGQWWVRGGPRQVNDHHPLPLFGPGMNRLATVGFRCVKDE